MIDNLTEAIAHAKKVAENVKYNANTFTESDLLDENCRQAKAECLECAAEYNEQLASWLTELQERREADRWIPVSEKLPNDRDWYLGVFKEPDTDFIGIPYICDYVGEITKGTTNEGWILRNCTDVDNVSDYFRNLVCVAWKPLPKPYKENDNE